MNYIKIEENSIANGIGIRTVLWVSGCRCGCKGCHSKFTWDFNCGELYTKEIEDTVIETLKPHYIDGLTLSGGHPLEPENLEDCTTLARRVKEELPHKTVWLYTGFLWEDIKDLEIIKYLDVIVDGKYVGYLRDYRLDYCGSTNQRVIDVKKSLKENRIVLFTEN